MDRIIEVKVNGNYVSKDGKNAGTQGEYNITAMRIEFDEGWDGFAKHLTFWDACGENPVERILTTDLLENINISTRVYKVMIPGEPLVEAGEITFVIDGYIDGARQRSVEDKLVVKPAKNPEDVGKPADPTPTQAEQLQVQIDSLIGEIQQIDDHVAKAEAAADRAAMTAEGIESIAEEVEQMERLAEEAEAAKESAKAAKDAATASATNAERSAQSAESAAQEAAQNAAQEVNNLLSGKVAAAEKAKADAETAKNAASTAKTDAEKAAQDAENAKTSAQAAQNAAEEAASEIEAGDYASKTEAQGYANTAESNAKRYTDLQLGSIDVPNVDREIADHNAYEGAHPDIREAITGVESNAKRYTNEQIAAIPTPDVSGQINAHNSSSTSHDDIRQEIRAAESRAKSHADAQCAAIEIPDVDRAIEDHNAYHEAHADIRQDVSGVLDVARAAQETADSKENKGVAASAVKAHNESDTAHSDIRTAVDGKEDKGTAASLIGAHNIDEDAHVDIRATANTAYDMAYEAKSTAEGQQTSLTQMEYDILLAKQDASQAKQAAEDAKAYADEKFEGVPDATNIAQTMVKTHNEASDAHSALFGKKLDKLSLEHWKEMNFGSTMLLCVGKFGVYDSQITVEITATTGVTYSGKLVVATQNYYVRDARVYGDAANTISPNIYIKECSPSDKFVEIYFKPQAWSKNVIHVYGSNVSSSENVCTSVQSVPETATLKPTNALTSNFAPKNETKAMIDSHINATGNVHELTAAQIGAPTIAQMNDAIAAASLGGGGTGGGASSWAELGEGVGMGTLLEETTITSTNTQLGKELGLIVGNTYTVEWNGTTYEPTAINASALVGVEGAIVLGMNASRYPFTILAKPGEGTTIMIEGGDTSATVSISGVGNIIKPIPAEYLPDDAVIIDVLALPTANIDEHRFYRIPKGTMTSNQGVMDATVYIVEGLPATGEPVTADGQSVNAAYYNTLDKDVYGYLPDIIASAAGVPAGWYPFSTLAPVFGIGWGGVIGNILDDPMDGSLCLLMEGDLWHFKYGWCLLKYVGYAGTGIMAEVFNHPENVASGMYAHAEGRGTTASGFCGHAEGYGAKAIGEKSHAENDQTDAIGQASHAEGALTTASGEISHVEGWKTVAAGRCQHVQGKYNIEDTEGKYAHIVGNGEGGTRSNAHTLDWDGNAWFAGDIEAKNAVILASPNGTRYKITVSDNGTLSATAI